MGERGDSLTQGQHLLLDAIDLLNQTAYFSAAAVAVQVNKNDFKKIADSAPKPIPRTATAPAKEKPQFISTKALIEKVKGYGTNKAVVHTETCQRSRVYVDTGRCDCPVVEKG